MGCARGVAPENEVRRSGVPRAHSSGETVADPTSGPESDRLRDFFGISKDLRGLCPINAVWAVSSRRAGTMQPWGRDGLACAGMTG